MSRKQIANASQAFSLGATWGTPSVDNTMTQDVCDLINGTGQVLYTGDIVCLDATGTTAVLSAANGDPTAIGTVGSAAEFSAYPAVENIAGANVTNTFPTIVGSTGGTGIGAATGDGNLQPAVSPAWQSLALGFTNGSNTVTYGSASAAFVGQYIYTPYNASTNANPQVFQIVSFVANTSFGTVTVAGASLGGFSGTTGTFTCQVGRDQSVKGPGWQPPLGWTNASAFAPGVVVPIVMQGFGRVNVDGVAGTVRNGLIASTNASVIGAQTLAATPPTAAQQGTFIAVALEAYAQRDSSLLALGIAGHQSVRAIIQKF